MENDVKTEKKPIYKKWWFWLIIIIVVIGVCGTNSKKNISTSIQSSNIINGKNENNIKKDESEEGYIGQYYIKIKEHSIVYDTQNKPVLLVKLAYTNNNSEAKAFVYTLDAKAYQNGVELSTPIASYGIERIGLERKK